MGWLWLWWWGCVPPVPEIVVPAGPPPLPPVDGAVRVVLRVPEPHAARVEVELTAPGSPGEVTFRMPVWTPGSYLVREFSRQVETFEAVDAEGRSLPARKTAKNRWTVEGAGAVTARYTVYAHELSVRTAFVEPELGVLVGAALFMEPLHLPGAAYDVTIEPPPGWPQIETGLDAHPSGEPNRWLARDWDELIDSPWIAGALDVRRFEVQGVPHALVTAGADEAWDLEATADEVRRIAEVEARLWGVIPYDHYDVLSVIAEAGGGLEHLDSTLVMGRRAHGRDPEAHGRWLGLVSHELFHAWNVKRLRPRALGPFDYEREVYTPSLWIAEGWTAYYDDLILVRAGLIDGEEHLKRLGKALGALQRGHGRRVQPLSESGFDAWIKHYRPDENAANRDVDYYVKGALVAWLLDATIRANTGDLRSLDDVLRLAWQRFPAGYEEAELRAVISEVAGVELGPALAEMVDGTGELDWAPALSWWGLRFVAPEAKEPPEVWTGLEVGVTVGTVPRGSPAEAAGVLTGDELIAVNEVRVGGGDLAPLLIGRAAGETISLLVARRGRLITLPVTLATRPTETWELEIDPGASPAAAARRDRWWAPPAGIPLKAAP